MKVPLLFFMAAGWLPPREAEKTTHFLPLLGGHGEGGDPSLIRHPGQKGALILEEET